MKQASDIFTRDLIDKPKRGRPAKPDALTPAQRAQRYRDKLRAQGYSGRGAVYKRVIRYRGPKGETWSGRGQAPAWIRAFPVAEWVAFDRIGTTGPAVYRFPRRGP